MAKLHPTTRYAQDVVDGKITTNADIRASCQRHLDDLKRDDIYFCEESANRFFDFCAEVLRLNGGDYEGKPFELLGWQRFVCGNLFGWKRKSDNLRRFREAFVLTGKGSGKSPLAAAVALYMLVADGEERAEIFAAAATRDQAMILYRDAVAMVQQSPDLQAVIHMQGGAVKHNMIYPARNSFFKPIANDDRGKGQSGVRPHCAILDEIHEHANSTMVELMKAGQKSRKQPLILMITNTASTRINPAGDYWEYSRKVNTGALSDDQFFGFCAGVDDGDNPLQDESCWAKANPSLQEANLPGIDYLRGQVNRSRGMPAAEILCKRLNFCIWTDSANSWISSEIVNKVLVPFEQLQPEMLEGHIIYAGLDLSKRLDLTAFAVVAIPPDGGKPKVIVEQFTPQVGLEQRQHTHKVPYDVFVAQGHLHAVPGEVVDYEWVIHRIQWYMQHCDVKYIAYDRMYIEYFKQTAEAAGVELPLEPFGQGYASMSPAIKALEVAIHQSDVEIQHNKLLYYNFACATPTYNPAGDVKLDKSKSRGHIDGVIALAMAWGMYEQYKSDVAGLDSFLDVMYNTRS